MSLHGSNSIRVTRLPHHIRAASGSNEGWGMGELQCHKLAAQNQPGAGSWAEGVRVDYVLVERVPCVAIAAKALRPDVPPHYVCTGWHGALVRDAQSGSKVRYPRGLRSELYLNAAV